MYEFYMIIAQQKIFLDFFWGEGHLPPVSYVYGREGINLPHGRLKTLAALQRWLMITFFWQIIHCFQHLLYSDSYKTGRCSEHSLSFYP